MTILELPYQKERAVIINCGTHLSTTLSVLSVLRYCNANLVVVNCRLPKDEDNAEYHYLQRLQRYCRLQRLGDFVLSEMPLCLHGDTLDHIFTHIKADNVLLVDSDLEVLNNKAITEMRQWIEMDDCFGAGFFHGPYFGFARGKFPEGYYQERMWIPFTLLKVNYMREAIEAGVSFNIFNIYNDFRWNAWIGRHIMNYAKRLHIPLKWNPLRKSYLGFRPNYVLQDTGANIYKYWRDHHKFYAGARTDIHHLYVAHYDGITRSVLASRAKDSTATQYADVKGLIADRLRYEYNFEESLLQ